MKKYTGFLLATAGGVAAASAAQAADLPMKGPAYTPAPIANWAGFYVGLHAGANWQHADNQYSNSSTTGATNGMGFIGGGQIGYNWQRGNFVYGVEVDGSGLTGKGKLEAGGYNWTENQIRWLSTVRGRFGLAVGDTMAYATGGLAIGGVKNSVTVCCAPVTKSESKTRVGWTIGGGVEHMWNRNWTVALEGLFVDLGRSTFDVGLGKNTPFRSANQALIGRFKVNYKW
jgi:outer membrane immunogenic protein